MISLPNGCKCSDPAIHGATLKDVWYIHYRFYSADGESKKVITKGGINRLKTLKERRFEARVILDQTVESLKKHGANPISMQANTVNVDYAIHPATTFIDALWYALENTDAEKLYKIDIEGTIKKISTAAFILGVKDMPVKSVTIWEVLLCLNSATKKRTAKTFNRYRKHLRGLFAIIVPLLGMSNPVTDIPLKSTTTAIRETLKHSQRQEVDRHLKKKGLNSFRLFIRVFFTSGARITELLKVQAYNVNLKEQWFMVTIKKGKNKRQVRKTIGNTALRYWKLALRGAKPADYIFSKKLVPGPIPITSPQVTRRWENHVKGEKKKGGLGFTADFYSLKHSRSTETVSRYGTQIAADQNSHTTDAMIVQIYDVEHVSREHERLKTVDVRY